jgi:diaminopimelate epimerase
MAKVSLCICFIWFASGSGGCAIAIVALVTENEDQDHSIPLASILLVIHAPKDCVLKLLINGPLHSSIRSFISTHDLT